MIQHCMLVYKVVTKQALDLRQIQVIAKASTSVSDTSIIAILSYLIM